MAGLVNTQIGDCSERFKYECLIRYWAKRIMKVKGDDSFGTKSLRRKKLIRLEKKMGLRVTTDVKNLMIQMNKETMNGIR